MGPTSQIPVLAGWAHPAPTPGGARIRRLPWVGLGPGMGASGAGGQAQGTDQEDGGPNLQALLHHPSPLQAEKNLRGTMQPPAAKEQVPGPDLGAWLLREQEATTALHKAETERAVLSEEERWEGPILVPPRRQGGRAGDSGGFLTRKAEAHKPHWTRDRHKPSCVPFRLPGTAGLGDTTGHRGREEGCLQDRAGSRC